MFNSMQEVKQWLNNQGYILNIDNNTLMVKTGEKLSNVRHLTTNKTIRNYTLNQDVNIGAFELLIDRINSNIGNMDLIISKGNIPITKIDMGNIREYRKRNLEIKQNQELKDRLKDVDYVFTERYGERNYYAIKGQKLIEINQELIDEDKTALQVEFITDIENALTDNLSNVYESQYNKALDDFNKLGVMVDW